MAAGHLIARSNQAGYMTATVLSQLGQESLARERGPYMKIGHGYPAIPNIFFGKARKIPPDDHHDQQRIGIGTG